MKNNWGNYTQSEVNYEASLPVLVSYATPVGIENDATLTVSERNYSRTTSAQINRYARENGLTKKVIKHADFLKELDKIGYSIFRGHAS